MTPSQRDKLAELLTSRRKAKGLSIRGVASAAGVDAATVLSLEQGRIEQPKAAKLRAVGGALGIPAAELYAAVGWLPGAELPAFAPTCAASTASCPRKRSPRSRPSLTDCLGTTACGDHRTGKTNTPEATTNERRNAMNKPTNENRSVLASLRAVIPIRPLDFAEAMQIAELQAARLLELAGVVEAPISSGVVTELPRIRVLREPLPTSGMSFWDGRNWVIALNKHEPVTRQRFTLLHEYKHIVDHGATDRLYTGTTRHLASDQAEQAADYFAGCVLMSKRLVKRAWGQGLQRSAVLARRFGVSERAIEVRLAQLGLTEPRPRCTPPSTVRPTLRPRRTYYRQLSPGWLSQPTPEGIPA